MRTDLPTLAWQAPRVSVKTLDSEDHFIVLASPGAQALRNFPYGETIQARLDRAARKPDDTEPFVLDLPNKRGTRLTLARVKAENSAFELLTLGRQIAAAQRAGGAKRVTVLTAGLKPRDADRAVEATVAALLAAALPLTSFKRKPDTSPRLQAIAIQLEQKPEWLKRSLAEARGNHLARLLTALPPNELTPATYRQRVEKLARQHRWQLRRYDLNALRKLGAGAFLAVAQGSPEPDACILHLRYNPKRGKTAPALALVGKGICFDTGGTNLKPARHMLGMHEDMEGSAVALGTLLALTEFKVDFAVDCWLALAQNHIGPRAFKQNDVIKSANGTTIEIVHTDAEGRLVLADTLTLASREKPRLVVDYATLTGSCIAALGTSISGVFTNRPKWTQALIEAGEQSGERVWPFPLPNDYEDLLKSDVADIKQCAIDSEADHIFAGVFLRKFLVGDPAWVHVDLAAGNHKGGLAHVPTDITGFGVRFTLGLLLDQKVLD